MRGYQHALAAGHRPRGHRHADRRRAAARARGEDPPRPRARGVRRARLEVEGRERRAHPRPAARPRRVSRLATQQVHDGPRHEPRRDRGVRAPLRRGAHLPRDAPHQLVPRVPHGALATSRSRTRRARTASSSSSRTRSTATTARSSSPRRAPRRCSATRPSPCTRTTRATSDLHGKKLVHPFVDRKIPIITDAILVDMKFGTGAVKVTPAHDFNDFATGKRHKLEEISIFDLDGTMNANGGPFKGLDRKEARTAVKKALDEKGLARGSKPHMLDDSAVPALGRRRRADDLDAVVLEMKAMARARARRGARRSDARSSPRSGRRRTTTSSRTSRTGASRASSGGGTRSPRGTARTARSRSRASARPSAATELDAGPRRARHVVLERALAVLDARLARTTRRRSRSSIRPTRSRRAISRPATTSSSSGSRG